MQLSVEQTIIASVAAVVATFVLVQGFGLVIRGVARVAGARPPLLRSLRDVITVIWLLVAATSILSITGLASQFTTLTLSGIVGIAISLALQSTLSNVISGVLLFRDKAIRLGDEIQFGGVKGRIIQIGLRATWVRTAEGNVVLIGNSNLSSGPLVNYSSAVRLAHLDDYQEHDEHRTGR